MNQSTSNDKKNAATAKEIHDFLMKNQDRLSLEELKLISAHSKTVLSQRRLAEKTISATPLLNLLPDNYQKTLANGIKAVKNFFSGKGAKGFEADTYQHILNQVIPRAAEKEKYQFKMKQLKVESEKLMKKIAESKEGKISLKDLKTSIVQFRRLALDIKHDFFTEFETDSESTKAKKAKMRAEFPEVLANLESINRKKTLQVSLESEIQTFDEKSGEDLKPERRVKAETVTEDRAQSSRVSASKKREIYMRGDNSKSVRGNISGNLKELTAEGQIKLPFDPDQVTLEDLSKLEKTKTEYLKYALQSHMIKIYKANNLDPGFRSINSAFVANKLIEFLKHRVEPIEPLEKAKNDFKAYLQEQMQDRIIEMDPGLFRDMTFTSKGEVRAPDELFYAPEFRALLKEYRERTWVEGEKKVTLSPMDPRQFEKDRETLRANDRVDALKAAESLFEDAAFKAFLTKIE